MTEPMLEELAAVVRAGFVAYEALDELRKAEMRAFESEDPERHKHRVTAVYLRAIETQAAYNAALSGVGAEVTSLLNDFVKAVS